MPFVCDLCGKTLSTRQRLQSHYDKQACGDLDKMPEPNENNENKQTDEQNKNTGSAGLDLFSGQSSAGAGDNYICGACDYSQARKFTYCPSCGAENEF